MKSSTGILLVLLLALATAAQQPQFRAQSALVQIPVTVLDHHQRPVTGLDAKDFQLSIDGRKTPIAAVDFVQFAASVAPPLKLPPSTYTNRVDGPAPQRLILLVDYTHTPIEYLGDMHRQLGLWLRQPLPPGEQVAIFAFDHGLQLLQPFTSNREELQAALRAMIADHSGGGKGQEQSLRRELEYLGGAGAEVKDELFADLPPSRAERPPITGGGADGAVSAMIAREVAMLSRMKSVLDRQQAFQTFDLLRQLAEVMDGIPGRKNIIWMTTSTSLMDAANPSLMISPHVKDEVFALLNQANIALYPLDVSELETTAPPLDEAALGRSGPPGEQMMPVARAHDLENSAMHWAASDTGGEAFMGGNSFVRFLDQIEQRTTSLYEVSFVPPEAKARDGVHKIRLSLRRHGMHLFYRRTYSDPVKTDVAAGHRQFLADLPIYAVEPYSFTSLTIALQTGPMKPAPAIDGSGRTVTEDYLPYLMVTPFAPLLHGKGSDQLAYDFSCMRLLVALDGSSDPMVLPEQRYQGTMAGNDPRARNPAAFRSQFIAPLGHLYLARLIVRDNLTGKAGSVTFRLDTRGKQRVAGSR